MSKRANWSVWYRNDTYIPTTAADEDTLALAHADIRILDNRDDFRTSTAVLCADHDFIAFVPAYSALCGASNQRPTGCTNHTCNIACVAVLAACAVTDRGSYRTTNKRSGVHLRAVFNPHLTNHENHPLLDVSLGQRLIASEILR